MKRLFAVLLTLVMLVGCCSFAAADKEKITVPFMITMNPAEEKDLVQAELNRMLEEKGYNFEVELVGIDFASWGTQMSLLLSDGSVFHPEASPELNTPQLQMTPGKAITGTCGCSIK